MKEGLRDAASRRIPARLSDSVVELEDSRPSAISSSGGAPSKKASTAGSTSGGGKSNASSRPSRGLSPVAGVPPSRRRSPVDGVSLSDHESAERAPEEAPHSSDESEAEAEVQAPPSAQRPRPRPLAASPDPDSVNPVEAISKGQRTRIQNDRDLNFFLKRSVVREIESNPPKPPTVDDSSGDEDQWLPKSLPGLSSSKSTVNHTSKPTHGNSNRSSAQTGANKSGSEEESISSKTAPVVDLTGSSPTRNSPPAAATISKLPLRASKGKGKLKPAAQTSPTKSNTATSLSKKTASSSSSTSKTGRGKASASLSTSARKHQATSDEPEDALKRALDTWNRAKDEYSARVKAEAAGQAYTGPVTPASEKYVLFGKPELKNHPSSDRDEVGIAFTCLCCTPPYVAWRTLTDSSTSLLGTHLKTQKSLQGQAQALLSVQGSKAGTIDRFLVKGVFAARSGQGVDIEEPLTQMQARQMAVGWVSESARPISILEDRGFQEWLPSYRKPLVPTRQTTSKDIHATYNAMQPVIKERLASVQGCIHLALDAWSSSSGHSFLGLVGCWQEHGVAQRRVLDMITLTERHTAERLAKHVADAVRHFGIEDKLWCIVGDNASVNNKMMEILGQDSSLLRFQGENTQIRCMAHVLNLVSEAILKPFNKGGSKKNDSDKELDEQADEDWSSDDDLIEGEGSDNEDGSDEGLGELTDQDGRAISRSLHPALTQDATSESLIAAALKRRGVAYPHTSGSDAHVPDASTSGLAPPSPSSELLAENGTVGLQIKQLAWFARKLRYNVRLRQSFEETCANYECKRPYTLIRDVATRWNSTFEMIKRALVLWDAIICWQELNIKLVPAKFRIKRSHKAAYEQIVKILTPLHRATLKLSQNKVSTIAEVIGVFEELDVTLRGIEEDEGKPDVWREAAKRGNAVAATYYGLADATDIYYLAVLLHPNLRNPFMRQQNWEPEWMEKAETVLRQVYETHYHTEPEEPESQPQSTGQSAPAEESYMQQQMRLLAERQAAQPLNDPIKDWCDGEPEDSSELRD
ncbi:hypothetical protein CF326_g5041 [Tilletia indica]|nr:hypothetical protein CF326_g5041 [Tilletia indica]